MKRLNDDNPFNIECIIDRHQLDRTKGTKIKMDTLVVNADVVRAIKLIYDIKPSAGWGEEYFDKVCDFFHPQNLTLSVRTELGMPTCEA